MILKPMDPEAIRRALEGHENVLTPAAQKQADLFKSLSCPSCGSGVTPYLDPQALFRPGEALPRYLARCTSCGCEFEPNTGIQINSR